MKLFKTYLLAIFVTAIMVIASTGSAVSAISYSGAWIPNDGDVNFFNTTKHLNPTSSFSFFLTNGSEKMTIVPAGATINYDFSTHILSESYGTGSLQLGNNDLFWMGYTIDGVNDIFTYSYEAVDPGKQYLLFFDNSQHAVYMVDAQPVPLPGAAWLMGAGLLTLVGLRRKYNVTG